MLQCQGCRVPLTFTVSFLWGNESETSCGHAGDMSAYYRMRIELPNRPGSLARLAAVLASHGSDILSLDIHVGDDFRAIDEIVASVPESFDPLALAADLTDGEVGRLLSCQASHGTIDRVARALGWATALVQSGLGFDDLELSRTVAEISGADRVWIASVAQASAISVGQRALSQAGVLVEHVLELPAPLCDASSSAGWLMVIADSSQNPASVAFAARSGEYSFTTTETARVQALLLLHRQLASQWNGSALRYSPGEAYA